MIKVRRRERRRRKEKKRRRKRRRKRKSRKLSRGRGSSVCSRKGRSVILCSSCSALSAVHCIVVQA